MEFSERVIVLQLGKFKEIDMWVRFLSPTRGILSAFAFGGSLSRRRFVGCLDVYNHVLFRMQLSHQGKYLALHEGVLLQGLVRLRHDWARYGIASNCSKFMQAFGISADGAESAYSLFSQLLQLLEEKEKLPDLLPFLFRARMCFDQGYALDLDTCFDCDAELENSSAYLHVRDGKLLCKTCGLLSGGHLFYLSAPALRVLKHTLQSSLVEWDTCVLTRVEQNECARAIDNFIQFHVGLTWENGRFIRV